MSIRPEESLAKMIAALEETTGRTLEEWTEIIAQRGLSKHGEIMSMLKGEFGISHGYANQIALRSRERLQDIPADLDPIEQMFAKRPEAKAVYDEVLKQLNGFGDDVDLAPKKGYVSVRRKKQFAILQPASGRLDVGINLKGTDATERLEPSGSFNAMLSHRVRVTSPTDVDPELVAWLRQAYDQA
jgi:hypothetical protein